MIKARDGDVWLASAGQGLRHATRDLEVDPSLLDEMGLDKPTFFEAKVTRVTATIADKCGTCPPDFFNELKRRIGL